MANVQIAVVEDQSTRIDVVLAIPGIQGVVGPGVAAGGSVGEVLVKDGSGNYATAWSDSLDLAGTLDVAGAVTIGGDLTVNGTTTTVDTVNLVVKDKNIELASVPSPTDASADGGGITLKGATDKTLNWVDATDSWTSSEHVNLANGKTYKINGTDVLSATALGSSVQISSSNIPDGTVVNADINANAEIAVSKLADGAARQLLQTDAAGTGVEWTSNVDIPGTLDVTSTATFDATAIFPAGSATAASVQIGAGTTYNPGLYSPGADQLAISTGGTGRLFVDSTGRVTFSLDLSVAPIGALIERIYQSIYSAFSVGTPGSIPFGVGPVVPPGSAFAGIGPDAYNPIHLPSGSFC